MTTQPASRADHSSAPAAPEPVPHARRLSDYTNDDGKAPDGADNAADDSAALRRALAAGPGVVYIGPGFYRWGDITIPAGVAVVGTGPGTVVRPNGARSIFAQQAVRDWALRDLVLDGEAAGDWHERRDTGRTGVTISRCSGYAIVGVEVRNVAGVGLQIERSGTAWANGGTLDHVTATGNWIGIRFDVRAEYINASALACHHNMTGCVIHAGNAKIAGSNFTVNTDGLVIEDKENGSHGAIVNCLVNHNERYALLARQVRNGMAISNCCFFYGCVRLEDCAGVNITDGILGCGVITCGAGVNRVAGNYVIPEQWEFAFAPVTIVRDNFTAAGPWERNR